MFHFFKQISPAVLPFLAFVCFVFPFYLKLKNSSAKSKNKWESFLEEEQQANFSPSKDLPKDLFIDFDISIIPKITCPECMEYYTKLSFFTEIKMVNLTNYSNLDLKKNYGISNFNKLIEYEKNYLSFIDILVEYGNILNELNFRKEAQTVLEYALSIQCNKIKCYELLLEIYKEIGNKDTLLSLKNKVENNTVKYPYFEKILSSIQEAIDHVSC